VFGWERKEPRGGFMLPLRWAAARQERKELTANAVILLLLISQSQKWLR